MKNKKLTIFLIILLSLITIFISIFFVFILSGQTQIGLFKINKFHNVSNKLVVDEQYENIFSKIKIDAQSSDIEIKENIDENIKVKIYGNQEDIKVDTLDSLNIVQKGKKCVGFCFNFKVSKIELYLPKDYKKEIDINNNYGDIEIENFEDLLLNVKMDCGDFNAENLKYLKIINSYGDIKVSKITSAEISEKCGNVKIDEVNDIKVDNKFGDIKIGRINNYLDINDNCGDIEINSININKNSSIKNNYGDIEIKSTNEIYIDAKTSLGDTKVKNNNKNSDIILKIDNDCGDIEVK